MKQKILWNTLMKAIYVSAASVQALKRDVVGIQLFNSEDSQFSGLTSDVFVKQIHSHNDYWRDVPLITALSYGVQSVEADIWNFRRSNNDDDELYVGHNLNALTRDRTLDSLYLNPLYEILEEHNPRPSRTVGKLAEKLPSGVFETDIHATLYFFIDFKTEGNALFNKVAAALERFKHRDWLSYYDVEKDEFVWRPLTVIGTGDTPLESVLNMRQRFIFFDGPLGQLNNFQGHSITSNISPIASASLRMLVGKSTIEGLNEKQLHKLSSMISDAHNRNIKTRVWDTPWWPVSREQKVWKQLLDIGSDFLNADDLELAVQL
ncbi:hypothetical protein FOA43_002363 [Brettanomyces nanus]|uniref:Altered inheritance of mitochondria protein 6 n=1 Tax=Eeniella nana TaxID=13502 RepID=A0A875S280_EENNA|nr:uncharacterized protein FOA43_002363 [Brettanomyces nanus]QPG75023.1 hypothetical protein FOA43_002363 [Brettanomyces nanus]